MAQIKGVINQAHRNNELEQIKQMYNSETTTLLNGNEDSILEMEQTNYEEGELSEEEDQIDINPNNETSQTFEQVLNLWKSMIENEFLDDNWENNGESAVESFLNDTSLETFISSQKHPQRDLEAKWKLADLFIEELGPPSYINNL